MTYAGTIMTRTR